MGFKVAKEEPLQIHMRRSDIHAVVRLYARESEVIKEFRFHQDVGRPHRTLERSGKLFRFREELQSALGERARIEKLWEERDEKALDEHLKYFYCCPYYRECPSFREDRFICTYRFCDRSICEDYQRLKRGL